MNLITAAAACTLALAALASANAQADQVTLSVRVDNVRPAQGAVRVAMFSEGAWLSDQPVAALQIGASGASVTLRLIAPAAGRYGLAAYQDLNGDGELNRNLIGIPVEPYGFSNDAPLRFGPPRFTDAALDVGASGQAIITLR
jgi:uncharacterized protein (DUF2141 family)